MKQLVVFLKKLISLIAPSTLYATTKSEVKKQGVKSKKTKTKSEITTQSMKDIVFSRPKRKVNTIFIHCSDSDNIKHDDVGVIENWHRARGFKDVGYHYFIKSTGELQEGRDLESPSAAQKNYNKNAIAICLHGSKKFNYKQLSTLYSLTRKINKAYDHKMRFRGHCEVNLAKTCPVFNYKASLNLDDSGHIKKKKS